MAMNAIPTLSPDVLQTFTDKKVVIYQKLAGTTFFYSALRALGVRCLGYYDPTRPSKTESLQAKLQRITRFTKSEFLALKKDEVIVQVQARSEEQEALVKSELRSLGFVCSDISSAALFESFFYLACLCPAKSFFAEHCQRAIWRLNCKRRVTFSFEAYKRKMSGDITLLCLPMKTADYTIMNTLGAAGIDYFNSYHNPKFINRKQLEKQFDCVKIITAFREPISQNISSFFQLLSAKNVVQNYQDWYFGDLDSKLPKDKIVTLKNTILSQTENAYPLQALFDAFLMRYVYGDVVLKTGLPRSVQAFSTTFNRYVIDITKYPFDQEKGYAIIKEGNTEVFVYQLEKLNSLVPELSAWVGTPFEELKNGNETSGKWVADSYKQAQSEIAITQEYFDKCFNDPYVKHCYSEADIEKFKARWRPHIKG